MSGLELIVIGGSAGAVEPLLAIVGALPAGVTTPILVVLHVPPTMPSLLPALLARAAPGRRVREVIDKTPLGVGTVHVAPPDYHLLVERTWELSLSIEAPVNYSRPSIDVLFESAAAAVPGAAGVLLSGTNHDGARGLAALADAGGPTIVQADAEQPTMPQAGGALVPSARRLPAREIADCLVRLCRPHSGTER